jgi:hypothetical protein
MSSKRSAAYLVTTIIVLSSCSSLAAENERVARGEYLVGLLGCTSCHTDGQLFNKPKKERFLAGSEIGIAYTNDERPGVVFPANLTSDDKTGLGRWTAEEITRNIRFGIDKHGRQQLPIMPWPGYQQMAIEDAEAITAYLMSLPPIKHRVPENVAPNEVSKFPFVRFGVYLFLPDAKDELSIAP